MKVNRVKLFDPSKENQSKAVINEQASGILNWEDIKYPQFYSIYKALLGNFWTPFEINMTSDTKQYNSVLTETEREAFRNIIGLLAILDSVQPKFFGSVQNYLSDDSIRSCLIVAAQQEVVHNHSYSYVLSSVEHEKNQDIAFQTARKKEVYERNALIIEHYENFLNDSTIENLLKGLIASIILEGINFYSAFAFFYNLARHQKMVGTSTMISYIQRDENPHQFLTAQIIKLLIEENKDEIGFDVESFAQSLFKEAAEKENEWSRFILADIPEIDLDEMEGYIQYRANKCLSMINVAPIYEGVNENSMKWIRAYVSEGDDQDLTKTDFFEQKSRQYAKVTDDNGFDDL
ncbi:ribonucleotide-diphosphate reductase subunit beta [Bacillus sp. FJAT-22090]|uniref:ribonucleotide-diphosphate reductase subunit beta n=1 Tax=Bacillus sp. FJAT-22090 TaxID=1581038 RepID=UPI0011A7570C|nr:ribonucleotide-diphosphate reductase subunit beta [Bacillus sp. FJAT-22090]